MSIGSFGTWNSVTPASGAAAISWWRVLNRRQPACLTTMDARAALSRALRAYATHHETGTFDASVNRELTAWAELASARAAVRRAPEALVHWLFSADSRVLHTDSRTGTASRGTVVRRDVGGAAPEYTVFFDDERELTRVPQAELRADVLVARTAALLTRVPVAPTIHTASALSLSLEERVAAGHFETLEALEVAARSGANGMAISEGAVDWAKRQWYKLRIAMLEKKLAKATDEAEKVKILTQINEYRKSLEASMKKSGALAHIPDGTPHVRSAALVQHVASGNEALALRLHFNYEADLAGGAEHEFASEIEPVLHVFAAQGLGVLAPDSPDDGVVVVDAQTLAAQTAPEAAVATSGVKPTTAEEEWGRAFADLERVLAPGDAAGAPRYEYGPDNKEMAGDMPAVFAYLRSLVGANPLLARFVAWENDATPLPYYEVGRVGRSSDVVTDRALFFVKLVVEHRAERADGAKKQGASAADYFMGKSRDAFDGESMIGVFEDESTVAPFPEEDDRDKEVAALVDAGPDVVAFFDAIGALDDEEVRGEIFVTAASKGSLPVVAYAATHWPDLDVNEIEADGDKLVASVLTASDASGTDDDALLAVLEYLVAETDLVLDADAVDVYDNLWPAFKTRFVALAKRQQAGAQASKRVKARAPVAVSTGPHFIIVYAAPSGPRYSMAELMKRTIYAPQFAKETADDAKKFYVAIASVDIFKAIQDDATRGFLAEVAGKARNDIPRSLAALTKGPVNVALEGDSLLRFTRVGETKRTIGNYVLVEWVRRDSTKVVRRWYFDTSFVATSATNGVFFVGAPLPNASLLGVLDETLPAPEAFLELTEKHHKSNHEQLSEYLPLKVSSAAPSSKAALSGVKQTPTMREIVVDVPFNPAGAQYAKLDPEAVAFSLPGSRARRPFVPVDAQGRHTIPADATVSFNVYAETATHAGQLCRARAGEALMLVRDLLATTPSTADSVRAEWQTTGDVPLAKGFIDVRYAELVRHSAGGAAEIVQPDSVFVYAPIAAEATAFHEFDATTEAQQAAADTAGELAERVNASLDVFYPRETAPLGVSVPGSLARMHCPYYNTSAGLLWGSNYTLHQPRATPPMHFFDKMLAATLLRNDADATHVLAAVKAQAVAPTVTLPSSRYVSKLFVEMLTVYANAMVYLDDFTNEGGRTYLAAVDTSASPDASKRSHTQRMRLVRRTDATVASEALKRDAVNVVEDYKDARLGHGDDCEGVAKEIYTAYWQFRRTPLAPSSSPLLAHFHALARANVYVPALMLAAVTNKKLDTATHTLADEDALAHTYTAFLKTGTFLARLADAAATAPHAGLAARVRASKYAREYTPVGWHAQLDDVLIGEGTARASAFVRPALTYYATDAERARTRRTATRRLAAQSALVAALPMNVVQIDVPNRRLDDADGALAADREDVSDFYKANSAAYVGAFRDAGVLDFAFAHAGAATASGLTHGTRFTRFTEPAWTPTLRLVPYNALSERDGALADATLAQLEPMPAIRRDAAVAEAIEKIGAPASLKLVENLFSTSARAPGAATALLLRTPAAMPDVPHSVVVSVRAEDATDPVAHAIVAAVAGARHHFSAARVHTHFLSDVPVRGDETSLPPIVVHDIELQLVHANGDDDV